MSPDTTISRRDILKLFYPVMGSLLSACGRKRPFPRYESALPPEDIDEAMNEMSWTRSPFQNVEKSLELGFLKPPIDEFESGGAKYRVITCKPEKLMPDVTKSPGPQNDVIGQVATLLDQYSEVLLFQEQDPDSGKWKSIDLPGTVEQMYIAWELTRVSSEILGEGSNQEEIVKLNSQLFAAYLDPEKSVEEKNAIINSLPDYVRKYIEATLVPQISSESGANLRPIPDGISPEILMKLYLAGRHAKEAYDDNPDFLRKMAGKAGAQHCVFLPFLYPDDIEAIKAFKERFREIPNKPRVFITKLQDDLNGTYEKILVMHDGVNPRDLHNYDFYKDVMVTKDALRPLECWRELDKTEREEVRKFFNLASTPKWFFDAKVLEMHELDRDQLTYAIVPNKMIGLGTWRVAPALKFGKDPLTKSSFVYLFGEGLKDMLFPREIQEQSWESWIPTVDKIDDYRARGVRHIDGLGALSPKDTLARYLKGSLDPYDLRLHLAHMPDHPYLQAMWTALGMESILSNASSDEMNVAVSLTDLPIYRLKGVQVKDLGKLAGLENQAEMERVVFNGEEVLFEAGAFLPIAEIIFLKGEGYVLFRVNRDEKGGIASPFEGLKNTFFADEIHSALAIKLSDAMNGGVLPLDFDNNVLDAVEKITREFMIAATLIAWIIDPALPGKFVSAAGKAIQKQLLKVLYSLPFLK